MFIKKEVLEKLIEKELNKLELTENVTSYQLTFTRSIVKASVDYLRYDNKYTVSLYGALNNLMFELFTLKDASKYLDNLLKLRYETFVRFKVEVVD